jgi:uncharacterized protein
MEKYYFTYNDIHRTVRSLAERVVQTGFDPDLTVAIGTGGFIPARMLKTFLKKPILAVGIAYYDDQNRATEYPHTIQWIDEAQRKIRGKKILLIDEVDDSRVTLEYCIRELLRHEPAEIAVAVLHNKKKEKRGSIPPEVKIYLAGADLEDKWVCYPWDAIDIDAQEASAMGK